MPSRRAEDTKRQALSLVKSGKTRKQAARHLRVTEGHLANLGVPVSASEAGSGEAVDAPLDHEIDLGGTVEAYEDTVASVSSGSPEGSQLLSVVFGGSQSNRRQMEALISSTTAKLPDTIDEDMVEHDLVMSSAVYGVLEKYPQGIVYMEPDRKEPVPVGVWAFSGGTSLSMCHQVSERFSEDLDFVFLPHPELSKRQLKTAPKKPIKAASSYLEIPYSSDRLTGPDIYQAEMAYGGYKDIYIDVSVLRESARHVDELLIEQKTAWSLVGKNADDALIEQHPNWGGFSVPCVGLPYIAASKMSAQHKRAEKGLILQISERARDIYDLYCIATSDDADRVREHIPAVADILIRDFPRRGAEPPRPKDGYANIEVFRKGSEAYEAASRGWEEVKGFVFAESVPDFDEMVEAARSLDG